MINYGKVKSDLYPPKIEVTPDYVFISSDVQTSEKDFDGETRVEYEYNYTRYTKDEYIQLIAAKNDDLSEELEATKILLGLE